MTSDAAIRRFAGGLLLWSLVPFPFLYVLSAPFWLAAAAVGLWRFWRPERVWRPSRLLLNLLGVAILAAVISAGGFSVGPLRPLGHLLLLLTAVRVATLDDLRDLRRVLPALFLVALVGIVSAVHVSIVPFLLVSFAVWWYVGMRVFLLEVSEDTQVDLGRPRWRHAVAAATAAALIAVPVFLLLPRLRSPLVGTALGRQAGYSDTVRLSRTGEISESRSPAAYVAMEDGSEVPLELLRLRATGFDLLTPDTWGPRRSGLARAEMRGDLAWFEEGRDSLQGTRALDITLVERDRFLFLPPGIVALEISEPVFVDPAGGVLPARRDGPPPRYRAWVDPDGERSLRPAEERDLHLPRHDERIHQLADRVVGSRATTAARAAAIEAFLESEYAYSLEGLSTRGGDPVAWFLFEGRQGHCEFFAASMAVMLRHLGVESRVVAGYHGGDSLPGENTVVVRKDNAHAWVEVWLAEEGRWAVFDPTPAEGIDGLETMGLLDRVRTAWQTVEDFFDRRVLTFSLTEQMGILTALGAGFGAAGRWILDLSAWALALPVLVALALGALAGRRRLRGPRARRSPAVRAVRRLRRKLRRAGEEIMPSTTVEGVGRRAARRWPAAAQDIARLTILAQEDLYSLPANRGERASDEARRHWNRIRKTLA